MRIAMLIFPLALSIVALAIISCTSQGEEPLLSSSSTPYSSSLLAEIKSSSSSLDCSAISSSSAISEDLCSDFDQNAEIEHYGKMKKQFCDERDGKKYAYVQIGEQTWMAENLNYDICGSKCGEPDSYGMGSLKDINTKYCDKYGRLYNWSAALIVCPDGWHLPSDDEWAVLTDYVGGDSIAGVKLRTTSEDWDCRKNIELIGLKRDYLMTDMMCPNIYIEGADYYGFSALPGGSGYDDRNFYGGDTGYWWSDTMLRGVIYYRNMRYDLSEVTRFYSGEKYLLSVRCVKDY